MLTAKFWLTPVFLVVLNFSQSYAQEAPQIPDGKGQQEEKANFTHTFSILGEFWTRPEMRDGYLKLPSPDSKALLFVPNRSRLIFSHKSEKITSKFVLQDSRVFGQTKLINNTDIVSAQVFEAWIKYDFTPAFSLKTGRQMLNYGDRRLINDRNWNIYGASYDLMILQYVKNQGQKNQMESHLAFGSNANSYAQTFAEDYKVNNHKYLSFLWVSKKISDRLQINFLDVLTGNQEAGSQHTIHWLNTVGVNPVLKSGSFAWEGSAYYQSGKNIQGLEAEAFMMTTKLSYSWPKLRIDLGTDYYSGKSNEDASEKSKTFNPLNYAGHGYLGEMDYFVTIPKSGIQDHYLKFNYFFNKKLSVKADLHWFDFTHQPADPLDPGNVLGKHAGKELDANIAFRPSPEAQFSLGYSFFLPATDFEQYNNLEPGTSRFPQWAWLSMLFKPTIFEYKKTAPR